MSATVINNYILRGDTSQGEIFGGKALACSKWSNVTLDKKQFSSV